MYLPVDWRNIYLNDRASAYFGAVDAAMPLRDKLLIIAVSLGATKSDIAEIFGAESLRYAWDLMNRFDIWLNVFETNEDWGIACDDAKRYLKALKEAFCNLKISPKEIGK